MATLGNLAVGSKVKFGKYQVNTETAQSIVWTIVAKNHSGYPASSVTLHAAEILDLRCFDAKEPSNSNSDRQSYGNNRYSLSNIDQWLNKNAAANAWYTATHTADQSPNSSSVVYANTQYANRPGFLNGFTTDEINAILSTTIRVVKPSVDGGSYEDIQRKVFLPSTTEVGLSNENSIAEGSAWGYYTSNSARIGYVTQQCFSNTPSRSKPSSKTTAWYWWLRTPHYSHASSARHVFSDGSLSNNYAYDGDNGVRPALNLSSGLTVSDSTDSDGCYTVSFAAEPVVPNPPASITASGDFVRGGTVNVTWSATDSTGGSIAYRLKYQYTTSADAGFGTAWTQAYFGSALSASVTIPDDAVKIRFLVASMLDLTFSEDTVSETYTVSAASPDPDPDPDPDPTPEPRPGYPVTSAAYALFAANAPQIAKITFSGVDETLTITNSDIAEGGLTIDRSVCSGNAIEVGSCIAAEMQLILDNNSGKWNDVKFEGAEMYVQIGVELSDGTIEYCPFGYFTVDEVPRKLSRITLTALDRMVMFDRPYDATQIAYPCTVAYLVDRICTICGVTLRTSLAAMTNASYTVSASPAADELTYREILSWCLEIMGCCGFIDWTGQLVVGWYENTSTVLTTANRYSSDIFENAISITGVDITYNDTVYSAGTDGYRLNIEGNGLIQSDPSDIAANLYAKVSALSYKPFSAVTMPYIDIYPLDVFSYRDASENVSTVAVTATNFCLNCNLSLKGAGETSTRRGYASANPLTARERVIIEDVARRAAQSISREESAALQLNETIANSFGLYRTAVTEADGSTSYYFSDKSTLAGSSIIYTFKSGGFAWTTSWNNGSPVWQYGITKDGNALFKTLSANKLTADYIDADTLTVQKVLCKKGNTTVYIDPTNGVKITTSSGTIFNVNTNDVTVKLSAASLSLTATQSGGTTTTETVDVGTVTSLTTDTYNFTKGSDGYYVSTNKAVVNSYAYATVYFGFTETTTVNLSCISYGESNYDYGIVSVVDAELEHSSTADSTNVLKSFKGLSSSSATDLSISVPSGNHFITIKYIKDGSQDSGDDTFKFRATTTVTKTTGNSSATLKLTSGGAVISSANITFDGFVTFNDLSQSGSTTINGANITTGKISADRIDVSSLVVDKVVYGDDHNTTILTSSYRTRSDGTSSATIVLGDENDTLDRCRIYTYGELIVSDTDGTGILNIEKGLVEPNYKHSSTNGIDLGTPTYGFKNGYFGTANAEYLELWYNLSEANDPDTASYGRLYVSSNGVLKYRKIIDGVSTTYNVVLE